MEIYPAIAEDGPLAGDANLRVEKVDGDWPRTHIWTRPGKRHLYHLKLIAALKGKDDVPTYAFVRTLGADEAP